MSEILRESRTSIREIAHNLGVLRARSVHFVQVRARRDAAIRGPHAPLGYQVLLPAFLLTLGSLALIPSCADNNSSLFVVGVMSIDASSCLAKPDNTAVALAEGVMDVAFTSSYSAWVLVGNQLTERGSREQLRTETSRIALRGAEVTLTTLDGYTLGNYSTVGSGFVDASAGDVPAYAAMAVNVIPSALGTTDAVLNAGIVLAKIRVFGDTLAMPQ